jgi:ADP-ribose pyrophosphatase
LDCIYNIIQETLHSEQIFSGKVLKLRVDEVLLSDGRMSSREIVEHNGGVGILAVRDKKIILVRQFRKPIESSLYEIPAGKLEKGEDTLSCAIREMEEETGLVPENIELLLTIYPSPGFSSEKLYIYMSDS